MISNNQESLEALDERIQTLLPEEYQDCYDNVQPVSMGSAGLKYGVDGKVAWDEIWGSFCDLAMAGGPPHKGTLLEPGAQTDIDVQPDRYREVVEELCRGIEMVAELPAEASPVPGWVRVECLTNGMSGWLARAIVMENVSAYCDGLMLDLPAAPNYRIEKEIKNVITVIAKTCHYWVDHMWGAQHRDIANLFAKMSVESPLIQPALVGRDFDPERHRTLSEEIAGLIQTMTGLQRSNHECSGWVGLECLSGRAAIWMMRALVASNVLARREETVLFVPVNPAMDPDGRRVAESVIRIRGYAIARGASI